MDFKRGVAIVTYNRSNHLPGVVQAVIESVPPGTRVAICDDGSNDGTDEVVRQLQEKYALVYLRGNNLGVGANKNRALWALQDCHFGAILEDDIVPVRAGWFETYEKATMVSGIHHFCRVQDKVIPEAIPEFYNYLGQYGLTPIYGASPRGDITFYTIEVTRRIGAFHPDFKGAGYAHGQWSNRVITAGLVGHPNKWVDIQEANECFVQRGDTEGGRWKMSQEDLAAQLRSNKRTLKRLNKKPEIFHPLVLV